MDDEVKGKGNSVNYKYRMHDPRIGRFFAIDPLAPEYPHYTPYQFSGNKLISYRELEGLEEIIAIQEPNGDYTLVWDITARERRDPNQFGNAYQGKTIIYVTRAGQVLQGIRRMNSVELNYPWIFDRVTMATPEKFMESNGEWEGDFRSDRPHDVALDGTPLSLNYPSTGIYNPTTDEITREAIGVPANFNQPPPPPPPPTPPAPVRTPLTNSTFQGAVNGGWSTFGFNINGTQITPFVNNPSVLGSAASIGNALSGSSFQNVTINYTLFLANNNTLRSAGTTAQNNAASNFSTQVQQQIATAAGVPTSQVTINVSFTTNSSNAGITTSFTP